MLFLKKTREYTIKAKDMPNNEKIRNWGRNPAKQLEWSCNLKEDEKGQTFTIKFTDREAKAFEMWATSVSEADQVPLYTFRCFKCKNIFPLPLTGKSYYTKLGLRESCKICESTIK